MAFIDILEKAGNIPEASYIKFLHQYKFKDKTLHFFFEGLDDQSFYVNFIETIFSTGYKFHYYVCNGKGNVYTNYQDINWSVYNKNRVLFFTDKDLDDILGITYVKDENIFETCYYSIENYIVTPEVYIRFLREICYILDESVINNLETVFIAQLAIFSEYMTRLSAWVVYCRTNNFPVALNDIDISKIFEITKDFQVKRIVPNGHTSVFEYICSATRSSYYNYSEIKQIIEKLRQIKPAKIFLRGKYELWFLYAFCKNTINITVPALNKIIKIHNTTGGKKLTKCKVAINLQSENLLQIVAPRVKIPEELFNFLNENFKKLA